MESKSFDQDVDLVFHANKGIVIGCFVSRNYDNILMETGKAHEQQQGHDKRTRIWC